MCSKMHSETVTVSFILCLASPSEYSKNNNKKQKLELSIKKKKYCFLFLLELPKIFHFLDIQFKLFLLFIPLSASRLNIVSGAMCALAAIFSFLLLVVLYERLFYNVLSRLTYGRLLLLI